MRPKLPWFSRDTPVVAILYPLGYTNLVEIRQANVYQRWFRHLKDVQTKTRINIALQRCRLSDKIVGDTKSVGSGIFELRVHAGPGYRVYYVVKGSKIMLLVVSGDRSTRQRDIDKAKDLMAEIIREDS